MIAMDTKAFLDDGEEHLSQYKKDSSFSDIFFRQQQQQQHQQQ